MKIGVTILAFILLFMILFILPNDKLISMDYWLELAQNLGETDVPTLTGGHSFDDGFGEGTIAVAYILSFPLRWAYFAIQQLVVIGSWMGGGIF